jgi:hypothetical protein
MTPEKALELCREVEWVKRPNGKFACKHRLDVAMDTDEKSDMCHHGAHFVCELVLYQLRKKAKDARGGAEALSVSRVATITKCPRQYAFNYVHGLRDHVRTPGYFKAGTAFGNGRAKLDAGFPFYVREVMRAMSVLDRAKVKAALRFYMAEPPYPLGVWDCEVPVAFELGGDHWVGYIDAISKNREHIVEWKFAVMPIEYLAIVRQAAVYMHGVPECQTFELIRFKKPMHRPKKQEKWNDYEERVYESLVKKGPEDIYDRLVIERKSIDAERIVRQMAANARLVPALEQQQFPPNYSKDCERCQYVAACRQHTSKPTFLIANMIESGECKT